MGGFCHGYQFDGSTRLLLDRKLIEAVCLTELVERVLRDTLEGMNTRRTRAAVATAPQSIGLNRHRQAQWNGPGQEPSYK